MSNSKKELSHELLPKKNKTTLFSSILIPELQKELDQNSKLAGNLRGLFILQVLHKKKFQTEYYLLFQGRDIKPILSNERPELPKSDSSTFPTPILPVVLVEIEDQDILNFATGGLTGMKAFVGGKIKIVGDLLLAQQLEEVFVKAGGVAKAMSFLEKNKIAGFEVSKPVRKPRTANRSSKL
ncbi:hypothetical protein HK099_007982 [Clydaea vesicula]|uniref:SCP2 domain-containing protein n=1 Tax=Clydaea vesicula TaxID=447962 RepID=A0AAD5U563_9FUNG|nr:hypothetical protein HK099_007982 [Clydaea vesicula]